MPQVRAALPAMHLGAPHKPAVIRLGGDIFFLAWLPETGPAGAGIEFALGIEQLRAAAYAAIDARLLAVIIFAGEGPFSAFLATNCVLLGGELRLPLLVGLDDFKSHKRSPQVAVARIIIPRPVLNCPV